MVAIFVFQLPNIWFSDSQISLFLFPMILLNIWRETISQQLGFGPPRLPLTLTLDLGLNLGLGLEAVALCRHLRTGVLRLTMASASSCNRQPVAGTEVLLCARLLVCARVMIYHCSGAACAVLD